MSLNCLLISINTVSTPYVVHPLGLAHIAGALQEKGHQVRQYDVLVEDGLKNIEQVLADFNPGLIGISIRNIDTVDSADPQFFLKAALGTIEQIKKLTTAPIVLGGGAFTLFPNEIMTHLDADFGVVGEGEDAICELAEQIVKGEAPIKGSLLQGQPRFDANWSPVAYDNRITAYYGKRGGMLNIQTKRGCPFRCDYCSYPLLEGRKFRYRDPKEVVDEAERLIRDYDCKYLFFTDSVFNDHKERYLEISEELIRRENKTPWCAYFRPSHLTRDAMDIMKRSGLHAMEFGTDASSDTTLKGMHKAFRMEDVFQTHELVREFDIPSAHFVIFGGPEETPDTLDEGLKNLSRLEGAALFGFSGIRILPNAPIHKRAIDEGVVESEDDLLEPVFYFSPHLGRQEMEDKITETWKGDGTKVFPVSQSLNSIDEMHQLGYIGPLWDKLL